MPSTVRGEVRSHINYFSPHPSIAGSLYPLPHESATHPHERHRERARNQSLFLFSSVLPSLQISLSLSLVSLSLRIFPNFVSVLLSLSLTPPSHPYALREIDFSTESPLPALPTRGTKELQCFCNVFHIVHASRNYYCTKKLSATSR